MRGGVGSEAFTVKERVNGHSANAGRSDVCALLDDNEVAYTRYVNNKLFTIVNYWLKMAADGSRHVLTS